MPKRIGEKREKFVKLYPTLYVQVTKMVIKNSIDFAGIQDFVNKAVHEKILREQMKKKRPDYAKMQEFISQAIEEKLGRE